ncbi:MAG: hypothetical protein ACOH2A_11885 [Sphingobacteriaceae bacterium]
MLLKYSFIAFAFSIAAISNGCKEPDKQQKPVAVKAPAIMAPFRYQKVIEVKPGLIFDILSWGRGSSSIGAFMILRSDSISMKYTTTTGDLDGTIVDVINTDLDVDGNPEIIIQAKASDSTVYAEVYAYEFNDRNDQAQKLTFPKLNSSQAKGYRGNDRFFMEEGKLMREFPLFESDDKDAKPTAEKRLLRYGLRNNAFTVQSISKDGSEEKAEVKPPPASIKKVTAKKTVKSSKKAPKKTAKKKKSTRR